MCVFCTYVSIAMKYVFKQFHHGIGIQRIQTKIPWGIGPLFHDWTLLSNMLWRSQVLQSSNTKNSTRRQCSSAAVAITPLLRLKKRHHLTQKFRDGHSVNFQGNNLSTNMSQKTPPKKEEKTYDFQEMLHFFRYVEGW